MSSALSPSAPSPSAPSPSLPWSDEQGGSLVLRTDFSDDDRWSAARTAMSTPSEDGFLANVEFVDDSAFDGLYADQVLERADHPWTEHHACLFLADATALGSDEWAVLYVDLHGDERGQTFRVIATELWSVENNLALGNMDLTDFTGDLDPDGVYRGF